eukprot:TRINITY_DN11291_c0_g1_i1.p1 TRINITY_DN11291_c0_g1~~TRINITY_DN11291_c0_g1_i1.p1  ORF type:complete len:937 (+),score=382.46 TRINITY_DN11291_c0_g1_i1:147-2957(+)
MEETSNNTQQEKTKQPRPPKEAGRGVVKAVTSGDTVLVIHIEKNQQGPPLERELTLTNISAPKLGRRKTTRNQDGTTSVSVQEDAPYAWQSREFLRKKLVGNQVSYTVETKDPKSGREYAVVYLTQGNETHNVARLILQEGWAKLRGNVNKDRSELEDLVRAEEEAEKANRGVWNEDAKAVVASKRQLEKEVNTTALYEQTKGKPQAAVVESVVTGSRLRLTLGQSLQSVELLLSGVDAPNLPQEGNPAPFAREAKFFTEHWLLNRDVQVLLEGADKYILYGSIASGPFNIAEELLKGGLGKLVEWSAARTAFADKLRAAEKSAKEKRLRIWGNYVEPKAAPKGEEKRSAKEFTGKVVKVGNGGIISILDGQGNTHELFLSSLKFPRAPSAGKGEEKKEETREEAIDRSLVLEGREFIRKRLIDRNVRVHLDYVRPETKVGKDTLPERPFYSVYLDKANISVELVENGLATVQARKQGEERSKDYEYLLFAEERAKKAGKGIHAASDKAHIIRINDLTGRSATAQAANKTVFPALKRHGKMKAVVEYVYSGSRFKLFIPRENCLINFSLAVAKTPRLGTEQQKVHEPFAEEAYKYSLVRATQRDVEIEVLSQDKGGNLIGELWINKKNLSSALLEEGLATTLRMALRESEYAREYEACEDAAKRQRKALWKNYDPQVEEEKRKARFAEREGKEGSSKEKKVVDVKVTEVVNGNEFFVQIVGPKEDAVNESKKLEELMKNLSVEDAADPSFKPTNGSLVKSKFSEDDTWYRAKVVRVHKDGKIEVKYVDYGNSEIVDASRLAKLDPAHATLKPQAKLARLAFLKAPALNDDFGEDAAEYLSELVFGQDIVANIEYEDDDALYLSVFDRDSNQYVNAAMVNAGLSRLESVRGKQYESVISTLKGEEAAARQKHNGIWQHGDIDSDDDEPKRPSNRGKK